MTRLSRRSLGGTLAVDGGAYRWSVYREPQWCTADGWKGLAIVVEPESDPRQQLFIEYPFPSDWKGYGRLERRHQRPKVSATEIASHIQEAIAEGWNPARRGRPFVFAVPKDG